MRKFTTFLLAATICVSICGCSNASVQREQTYEAIRNEDEDAGVVVTALQYTDDTDALETAPYRGQDGLYDHYVRVLPDRRCRARPRRRK